MNGTDFTVAVPLTGRQVPGSLAALCVPSGVV